MSFGEKTAYVAYSDFEQGQVTIYVFSFEQLYTMAYEGEVLEELK
jgi:hypothetical protein